jgi:hypothetical protein
MIIKQSVGRLHRSKPRARTELHHRAIAGGLDDATLMNGECGIDDLAFYCAPVSVAVFSLPCGDTPTIDGWWFVCRLKTGCPALCTGAIVVDRRDAFRERRFQIAITPGSRIVAQTVTKLS